MKLWQPILGIAAIAVFAAVELKLEPLAKYDADLLPIDPVERSSVRTYLKDK